MRFLAQFISFLWHPLLMPTWLFTVLMFFFPASIQIAQAWTLIIILIFGMTFILPVLNMLFFRMTGTIKSFYLPERKDRILPFIFITLVYAGISAMFFWKMNIPVVFKLMVIVTSLSVMVTIATFFIKISAHAVGICGMAGMLISVALLSSVSELVMPSILVIVLAGIVMSSRLLLNAHTLEEVGWGGVLGFVIGFSGISILL